MLWLMHDKFTYSILCLSALKHGKFVYDGGICKVASFHLLVGVLLLRWQSVYKASSEYVCLGWWLLHFQYFFKAYNVLWSWDVATKQVETLQIVISLRFDTEASRYATIPDVPSKTVLVWPLKYYLVFPFSILSLTHTLPSLWPLFIKMCRAGLQ